MKKIIASAMLLILLVGSMSFSVLAAEKVEKFVCPRGYESCYANEECSTYCKTGEYPGFYRPQGWYGQGSGTGTGYYRTHHGGRGAGYGQGHNQRSYYNGGCRW